MYSSVSGSNGSTPARDILRCCVIGTSAAGKSTFAKRLARIIRGDHIELDSLFHEPDWKPAEPEVFAERIAQRIQTERWVIDGNYGKYARALTWSAADTVIWLNYPFRIVLYRVLKRTAKRLFTKEELWNGNRESWRTAFSKESIVWWVITTHRRRKREFPQFFALPEFAHLNRIIFTHPRQAAHWLDEQERVVRSEPHP